MLLNPRSLLFLLFLASGFSGLLYQVVWIRLAFASFGVVTPVLSVVVSVFMAGLFAGSWISGRLAARLAPARAALAYAACEAVVASSAFAVPALFGLGERLLLSSGEAGSTAYLARSALVLAASLFPWCLAMGATLPLMMAYLREGGSFSFLYFANTCGAVLGTALTALFLIELLGFRGTLAVGAAFNLLALGGGLLLWRRSSGVAWAGASAAASADSPAGAPAGASAAPAAPSHAALYAQTGAPARPGAGLLLLFTTGFCSMALEVVWTRAFTAVLQTQVYSFALILFAFLLATALGSAWYRRARAKGGELGVGGLLLLLALASLLPLAMLDPRLHLGPLGALLSIMPFCALLGALTPLLVDRVSGGDPALAGRAYAINVLGCILGPLAAAYLLLAYAGDKASMLLMALPFFLLLKAEGYRIRALAAGAALLLLMGRFSMTYEDPLPFMGPGRELRRDHTATVISFGQGMEKRLLVNGVGITFLTDATKFMAHLPMALSPSKQPESLVICLGMGTTFRSLLSWGGEVTAVELAAGVRDALPFYFEDFPRLLAQPRAKVVIDDGRRFLKRTPKLWDVVTLDPPPPVEAAGSSLLYSEEFYALVDSRLKPGGILLQWAPKCRFDTVQAMAAALLSRFRHLRMYENKLGGGTFFVASQSPIPRLDGKKLAARMPAAARADLTEWQKDKDAAAFIDWMFELEMDPGKVMEGFPHSLTDDRPYNEYYLVRRSFKPDSKE